MKFTKLVAASLLAMTADAAMAQQDQVNLAAGTMVYGPQGGEVGTIEQTSGDAVVLNTGTNMATLAKDSFVKGEKGTTIGYTKAQLDEVINKAKAEQEAKLVAALVEGAPLRSRDGIAVGTVKTINEDGSVIVADDDKAFRLERSQMAADDQGLMVLFTAAQLNAALGQASGG